MPLFTTSKIANENEAIAAELIRARTEKKISLAKAGADLKIKTAYLEALEAGNFHDLPAGIYAKNFLKEYAAYLGLNGRDLTEIRASQDQGRKNILADAPFSRRAIKNKTWELSLILKTLALGLLALLCFAYLGYYLHGVISPPRLDIIAPAENSAITENSITIIGRTEPAASVAVNGEPVLTDSAGGFTREISLKSGINTITITARKKYGREITVQRRILVQK